MIHYSCDRCKRMIDPAKELRHVVRVEVQTILEPPPPGESEEDGDPMLEFDELLDSLDLDEADLLADELPQQMRFDLCSDCYRKFLQDPLGVETSLRVGFSSN